MFIAYENDAGLMAKGYYECYVKDCKETTTKSGKQTIAFDFVVRSDVDQSYQNKHIFKNFYLDEKTGEYPVQKIGKYANALGIEKGTQFDLPDLIGRTCIVVITHFTGDDGETRDCIFYLKPSKAAPLIQEAPSAAETFVSEAELDDDFPF